MKLREPDLCAESTWALHFQGTAMTHIKQHTRAFLRTMYSVPATYTGSYFISFDFLASRMAQKGNAYNRWIGGFQGKRPFGRSRRRWEVILKQSSKYAEPCEDRCEFSGEEFYWLIECYMELLIVMCKGSAVCLKDEDEMWIVVLVMRPVVFRKHFSLTAISLFPVLQDSHCYPS